MIMKNNNLFCKDLTDYVKETSSGFEVKKATSLKTLKVLESSIEDYPIGCSVRVRITAGEEDDKGVIIHASDVIYII